MTAPHEPAEVPPLALPVGRAAAALGLTENHGITYYRTCGRSSSASYVSFP